MPDLPPTSPTSEANLNNSEMIPPVQAKPKWLSLGYSLKHNRWLFLAQISGIAIIVLLAGLAGVLLYAGLTSHSPAQADPVDTQQPDNQPRATHKSDDDSFFAKQPLTVLYYSFAQTTSSKNMLQATPNDHENRVLDIGYPDKYNFSSSPDGKWLLRWNKQAIERSTAVSPQKFTTVFTLNEKGQQIESVVWQSDAASLAISTTQATKGDATGPHRIQVMLLPLVTLQPITIFDEHRDFNVTLIKYPTATNLYFVEDHNGNRRNLTSFNTQSKAVDKQFTALNQNGLLDSIQFSADMQWAYRTTETEVLRYNLQTMEQTSIYKTDRHCEIGEPNNNSIIFATVAPTGSELLVSEALTECPRQVRNRSGAPTPVPPTQQTTLYAVPDSKIIRREYNLALPKLDSSSWSPNGEYIWLNIDTQNVYILSTKDFSLSPVPSTDRHVITKERVFLVGWLLPLE